MPGQRPHTPERATSLPSGCSSYKRAALLSRPAFAARRPNRGEEGFTLLETAVAMAIMSILMIMVVAGMTHVITPSLQNEAIRDSSSQLDLAFIAMDSQVRYAAAVWSPVQNATAHDWNIEFETNFAGNPTPSCTELQYNYGTGKLDQATWPDTQTAQTTAPSFKVLASGLSTAVTDPFTVNPSSSYSKVQLMVTLSASAGTGHAHETTSSSVTFTAINTTTNAVAASTDCYPTGWGF